MSKPYDRGYQQGYLSSEELKELGHTPTTYNEYVKKDYGRYRFDPNMLRDNQEFYQGLLDGANDRAKK